jgi:hypothetical protein
MGIVNKAVQDGIGVSRIADHAVPMIDGKLACHNRGTAAIALLEDFEKVLPCLGVEHVLAKAAGPRLSEGEIGCAGNENGQILHGREVSVLRGGW